MFGTYVQRILVKGQQRYFVSQGKYRIRDLRESFKLRESFALLLCTATRITQVVPWVAYHAKVFKGHARKNTCYVRVFVTVMRDHPKPSVDPSLIGESFTRCKAQACEAFT